MNVALFITCLTEHFYPRSGIAAVKVLEHLGCTVTFPEAQTCCGQPMYNNGFHSEARALARRMVGVFAGSQYVVTPSASCAAMVREGFHHLFASDPAGEAAARDLGSRTFEFVEFLVKVLRFDPRAAGVRWAEADGAVTYHPSCHLRGLGMTGEATDLMGRINGLQLVPMDKSEQCCGFGGTFASKYPDISGAMVRDKVGAIRATGASAVVCNDAGCTMNIAGACRRAGCDVRFTTLAEVIAEGLGLLPREARA